MDNLKVNILHYLILSLTLIIGIFLFFMYKGKPDPQFFIGIGLALSYFLWGITHHYLNKDLHRKHVIEYGSISLLALILLKIILF